MSDGPRDDLVISSRVRLARNCSEFAFPRRLEKTDAIRLLARAERVFRQIPVEIGAPFSVNNGNLLERSFLSSDESSGAWINRTDHFRVWAMSSGLDLSSCLTRARHIESCLAAEFPFAVNLALGYLSPELNNLGTAMRASVLLHLPALVQGMAAQTLEVAMDGAEDSQGLELLAWGPADSGLYLVANRETLGLSEAHLLNKLDRLSGVLLHYERDVSERLMRKGATALADQGWRSLGLLRNCRQIGQSEALELLGKVRLGMTCGLVSIGPAPGVVPRQINAAVLAALNGNAGVEEQRADQLRLILA